MPADSFNSSGKISTGDLTGKLPQHCKVSHDPGFAPQDGTIGSIDGCSQYPK